MPKVSVIMSTYNDSRYIRQSVESILNQTYKDFEFIIIDDASTDETVSIIKSYNDSRIKLIINKENHGLTKNLNKALTMVTGQYIARMDGDDISFAKRLEKQIEYLDKHKDVYLIGTAIRNIGASDLYWRLPDDSEELRIRMLLHPVFAHPSFMFRKELVDEGMLYDESFRTAQDYDFAARVAKNHKIGRLQGVLLNYRVHEKQISQTSNKNQVDNAARIRMRLLNELGIELTDEQKRFYDEWVAEKVLGRADEYRNAYELIALFCEHNEKVQIYDKQKLNMVLHKLLYTWIIRSKNVRLILDFPYLCDYKLENMVVFLREVLRTIKEKVEKRLLKNA